MCQGHFDASSSSERIKPSLHSSDDATVSFYSFHGYKITRHRPRGIPRKDRNPGAVFSYVDAVYATCKETRRFVTGYIFILAGGPVSWNSGEQPSVALSTTEAEYMAPASAVQELV